MQVRSNPDVIFFPICYTVLLIDEVSNEVSAVMFTNFPCFVFGVVRCSQWHSWRTSSDLTPFEWSPVLVATLLEFWFELPPKLNCGPGGVGVDTGFFAIYYTHASSFVTTYIYGRGVKLFGLVHSFHRTLVHERVVHLFRVFVTHQSHLHLGPKIGSARTPGGCHPLVRSMGTNADLALFNSYENTWKLGNSRDCSYGRRPSRTNGEYFRGLTTTWISDCWIERVHPRDSSGREWAVLAAVPSFNLCYLSMPSHAR